MSYEEYRYRVIPADGDAYNGTVTLPDPSDANYYVALKDIVEKYVGYPMEHVRVFADFEDGEHFEYLDMFVNENGHIADPALPFNEAATAIYLNNVRVHDPLRYAEADGTIDIAGCAILFEKAVWR